MRWIKSFALTACVVAGPSFADQLQETPGTASSPLQNAVRLAPVPELSLMVPRGWAACDPTVNQQLGGIDLPSQTRQKLCDPTQPPGVVTKLMDPSKTELVVAFFVEAPTQLRGDIKRAAAESGDVLRADKGRFCYGVGGPDACEIRPAIFGGHPAVIGKIEKTPQSIDVPYSGKFVMIATSKHVYIVMFAELSTPHEQAGTIVDAIIQSIEAS